MRAKINPKKPPTSSEELRQAEERFQNLAEALVRVVLGAG